MDSGAIIALGLLWLALSLLGRARKGLGSRGERGRERGSADRSLGGTDSLGRERGSTESRPQAVGSGEQLPLLLRLPGSDPTQREGLRLEELLRELGRSLEQASRPGQHRPGPTAPTPTRSPTRQAQTARPTPAPLRRPAAPLPKRTTSDQTPTPDETHTAEPESLEVAPTVQSLEELGAANRELVDLDEESERIAARRVAEAEARSGPTTEADHLRFDQRIRREPADHTATPGYTARQLRQAVVWREILDPPLSLRDRER